MNNMPNKNPINTFDIDIYNWSPNFASLCEFFPYTPVIPCLDFHLWCIAAHKKPGPDPCARVYASTYQGSGEFRLDIYQIGSVPSKPSLLTFDLFIMDEAGSGEASKPFFRLKLVGQVYSIPTCTFDHTRVWDPAVWDTFAYMYVDTPTTPNAETCSPKLYRVAITQGNIEEDQCSPRTIYLLNSSTRDVEGVIRARVPYAGGSTDDVQEGTWLVDGGGPASAIDEMVMDMDLARAIYSEVF